MFFRIIHFKAYALNIFNLYLGCQNFALMKFKKLRWICVWIIGPIVAVVIPILKIPSITVWLTANVPDSIIIMEIVGIGGTLFIYFFSIVSPYKLYQKLAKRKWEIMKSQCQRIEKDYGSKYKFSYNIMLVRNSTFHFLEPFKPNTGGRLNIVWKSKKLSWNGQILKCAWCEGNDGVHEDLKISVNQGICGKAFKESKNASEVMGIFVDAFDSNFNEDQKNKTKDVIFVASCPLIIKEKDENEEATKRVGVLNFETRVPAIADLIADPKEMDKFYEKIANLANIYANLHV